MATPIKVTIVINDQRFGASMRAFKDAYLMMKAIQLQITQLQQSEWLDHLFRTPSVDPKCIRVWTHAGQILHHVWEPVHHSKQKAADGWESVLSWSIPIKIEEYSALEFLPIYTRISMGQLHRERRNQCSKSTCHLWGYQIFHEVFLLMCALSNGGLYWFCLCAHYLIQRLPVMLSFRCDIESGWGFHGPVIIPKKHSSATDMWPKYIVEYSLDKQHRNCRIINFVLNTKLLLASTWEYMLHIALYPTKYLTWFLPLWKIYPYLSLPRSTLESDSPHEDYMTQQGDERNT